MSLLGFTKYVASVAVVGLMLPAAANAADSYGSNGATSTATPQVVQQASSQAANLLAGRISQAVSNVTGGFGGGGSTPTFNVAPRTSMAEGKSKAAGDGTKDSALWINVGNAWVSNNQAGVNFSGTIQTVVVGADHMFSNRLLGGLSVGYEHPDVDTKFNNGTLRANNIAIAPYAAYVINDYLSVDQTLGYTFVNYDNTRSNGAVTSNVHGGRIFSTSNVNANTTVDSWQLGSSIGYMYLLETQDAYTESGTGGTWNPENQVRLGQARWTNKAAYPIKQDWGNLVPFGSVRLEYDLSHTPAGVTNAQGTPASNDRFGTTFGLGVNANIGNDTSLGIEGSSTQFREHIDVYTLSATLRLKF